MNERTRRYWLSLLDYEPASDEENFAHACGLVARLSGVPLLEEAGEGRCEEYACRRYDGTRRAA